MTMTNFGSSDDGMGPVTLRITRLPRAIDPIDLEDHVEETLEGIIKESSFSNSIALLRVATPYSPAAAASVLRQANPWEGNVLHVEVAKEETISAELTPPKKTKKKKKNNKRITLLAEDFHEYISNDRSLVERCSDREGAGVVFRDFLEKETDEIYKPFLEASVMTRLRQKKLLKSRRHGDKVIMCFADESGSFPSLRDREAAKARVLKQKQNDEADKEGVAVSKGQDMSDLVPVLGKISFEFEIHADPEACGNTTMEAVEVAGAQKRAFRVDYADPPSLLLGDDKVRVHFSSSGAGVYRAIIRMRFRNQNKAFAITRHLNVKSGDPEMGSILKPTSPYKKRSRRYEKPPFEVIPPPSVARTGINPLAELPQHKIPGDITQLIQSKELASILRKPDENVDDYEEFWKYLLWASEMQAHEDIKLFDMEGACLQREGKYFVLTVPGLAEGRPSVLRGDLVKLTWNGRQYQGRVNRVRLLDLLLEFDNSFHRSFNASIDTADVRFTFTRTTFRTSHEACRLAPMTMGPRVLTPKAGDDSMISSRATPQRLAFANPTLNEEQKTAVSRLLMGTLRPLPYIIFGPPGTGKTTTVTEAVYQLARHKDNLKVLLVAPSNDAADILVEKLAPYFPPSEMRRILAFTRTMDQLPAAVRTYATDGLSSQEQCAAIMSARIVVSTVNLAARFSYFGVPRGHFDVLCVDEAGHATEPEVIGVAATLMDFSRKDEQLGQLILAGDPRQLGPVITSDLCVKFGMSVSFMERLTKTELYARSEDDQYPKDLLTKLVRNYRSHPSILKLPNEMFYDNELVVCGDVMKTHSMARWEHLPNPSFPVLFHAVNGENLREGNSPSWFNPQEIEEVVNYVDLLVNETRPSVSLEDIGIITPYARQAQKIRLALKMRNFQKIKVGSVETFQGQERRCIILSTVRSEGEFVESDLRYNLGFVANEKRFNVAITRAQALVVVIGCPSILALDKKNWLPFLRYCRDNDSWRGQEWDEEEESDDDHHDKSLSSSEGSEWDLVHSAPSQVVEEEGMVFINREE